MKSCLSMVLFLCLAAQVQAQTFVDLVGPVQVQPPRNAAQLEVPTLLWGGDFAELYANGGVTTQPGSINSNLGLNIKIVHGDDFVGQLRNYIGGNPLMRGTIGQFAQGDAIFGSDPRLKPTVAVQLTYSAGDHMVGTDQIKSLNDLQKGDTIYAQQGGPHVDWIEKALKSVGKSHTEVNVVLVPDLTGPKGPAEAFRKDPSPRKLACVITPDMIGLTGGQDQVGSGAEGTVKGAHVVVSTQQMSRAIVDVWGFRHDWYQVPANKQIAEKYVAGYLKAVEKVVAMRKEYEESKKMSAEYRNLLQMAQNFYGRDALPTLEVDAHGLLLDATFVGLPGQISFFEDAGNLSGFEPQVTQALDFATSWGYTKVRAGFDPPGFDYHKIANLAGIQYVAPKITSRINAEAVNLFPDTNLDDRTIFTFTINFEPNEQEFSTDRYGAELNRAIQSASQYGNAVVVIRGHSDPTRTLVDLLKAGMAKGIITRSGSSGSFRYFMNGKPLDLEDTKSIVKLIESGAFDGTNPNPRETFQAALNLSLSRATALKDAIANLAKQSKVNLDVTQIQPVGAGILEPLIAKPKNVDEAKQNMRVEFKIVKVPAEAIKQSDFDF